MSVHFSEFSILMLVFRIIEGISLNVTGSSFTKNKYSDSHVILAFDKVGPLMCVSDCFVYKGCNAVNYNRIRLDCELLSVSFPGDNITDMEGSFYTDIVGWKMDKEQCTPNPCEVGEKCISAMYNNHICLSFDAPCDVHPCLHNGVCRNMVKSYKCICPHGYHGNDCENTPCDVHPCLNNGVCRNMASGYKCNCQEGHNGDNCEYSSGIISSPNYPGNYENNQEYKYLIREQVGQRITLTFSKIDTEECCDFVQVFAGSTISDSPLRKFSGSSNSSSTVRSTGNNMIVLFTSDHSVTGSGFYATYYSHS
ncbi:cubilin homolog [Mytilus edulis]|uniref:cubilin homolog n=1 Tax=Mytilus edulis TaxID=6550 RepID=UPI0039F09F71